MKKTICLLISFALLWTTTACTGDVVDLQAVDVMPALEVLPQDQSSSEALYQDSIRTFEATMEDALQSDGYSSAAVAILENGEIIYSSGFGAADHETGTSATAADTIYNIGSVSKVYVAAALLKLQEDDVLSLDDPVVKYLPEFTMADNRYEDITIRMLLNHTAGLPSSAYMREAALIDSDPDYGYYDSLIKVLADTTPTSDPGAYPAYSNDGFVLAQKIVERASGMDYADYLDNQFFVPMGLIHTSLSNAADNEHMGKVYDNDGNALPREVMIDDLAGAGAIAATAEDVCNFIWHLFSSESGVLSNESVAELRSIQNTDSIYGERSTLNGLGWDYSLHPANSVQMLSKNGGTAVYSSQLLTAPDAGLTVVGLCAGFPDTSPIYGATNQLMLDILSEKGYPVYGNEVDARDEADAPAGLNEYTGYYIPSSGPLYHCQVEGDTLTLSIWGG